MTAEKLQTNLAKHIDEVNQMKDQWPTDEKEAYKMIAHHVFMALYDVDATGAGGATGGSGIRGSSGSSGSSTGSGSSSSGSSTDAATGSSGTGTSSGTGSSTGTSRQRQ
jgi:hypothetical protein